MTTPSRPLASSSTAQPTHVGTGYFEMARDDHRLFVNASLRVRPRRREVRATHHIVRGFCEGAEHLTIMFVAGFGAVLLGVLLVNWPKRAEAASANRSR